MYYIESSLIRVKGLSFQKICGAMSVEEHNSIINCVNNIGWPLLRVSKLTFQALAHHQSKGLMLKTTALKPFMVANLHYQPS